MDNYNTAILDKLPILAKFKPEGWRLGQYVFNASYALFPEEVNLIRGGEFDCFYNNSRVDKFLLTLRGLLTVKEKEENIAIDLELFLIAKSAVDKSYTIDELGYGDSLYDKNSQDRELCFKYYEDINSEGLNWAENIIQKLKESKDEKDK